MANEYTSYDIVGAKEDVSDINHGNGVLSA